MNEMLLHACAAEVLRTFGPCVPQAERTWMTMVAYGFAVGWWSDVSRTVH